MSALTRTTCSSTPTRHALEVPINIFCRWFAAKGNQMTCATKSLILHLEWREDSPERPKSPVSSPTTSSGPRTPTTATPSVPRNRVVSLKAGIPPRKAPSGVGRGGVLRTPSTPISLQSPRVGTPQLLLPKKAAIVTAPPKIVALVETPDLAVGAVDPRKRRVITATRFSSRMGADRRVSTLTDQCNSFVDNFSRSSFPHTMTRRLSLR